MSSGMSSGVSSAVRVIGTGSSQPAVRAGHDVDVDVETVPPDIFRDVLGRFVTGVTVVTVAGVDGPCGATVNAFSSLSLDPPLVLVCLRSSSHSAGELTRAGAFAVNILAEDQLELGRWFAWKDRPRGRDAFARVAHRRGRTGSPLLDGTVGHVDCHLVGELPGGDHTIFVGQVVGIGADVDVEPLAFHRGRFGQLRLEATA